MYAVICLGDDGRFLRANDINYPDIAQARTYKDTVSVARNAKVVPSDLVDEAIEANNKSL